MMSEEASTSGAKLKKSRENTKEEKRRMNTRRKKRLRRLKKLAASEDARKALETEIKLKESAQKESAKYKSMSRTYWERWRWEHQKRKESMEQSLTKKNQSSLQSPYQGIQHINPELLRDPTIDGEQKEIFIGRGSFGVVKMQVYRGIQVAVKEFLPRTFANDVLHEASIMTHLCHPNLPMLFGVCLHSQPYRRIVMQCHLLDNSTMAVTIERELRDKKFGDAVTWLTLCLQLFDAVVYLHHDVCILHNDIKVDNILIANSLSVRKGYQIVLIDFGKATLFKDAKRYNLSAIEKQEYFRLYPHLAPEVIEGETKQSVQSDVFSLGLVIHRIIDAGCFQDITESSLTRLKQFAYECRNVQYRNRPHCCDGSNLFQAMLPQ